jgi:PAS domain S-box-containing protein
MQHLLIVEDDKVDQMAFERFAKKGTLPFTYHLTSSVSEAKEALEKNRYDAIFSDYFLGDGTAFDILSLHPDIPLVVVTGTGSEEIAVQALKSGAYDYLIKDVEGNYLKMLPVTLKNTLQRFHAEKELEEYHLRLEQLVAKRTAALKRELRERKKAEKQLIKLSTAVEQSPVTILITDLEGNTEYVNPYFSEVTGYSAKEILGQNPRLLKSGKHPDAFYKEMWDTITAGKVWRGEFLNKKKNGRLYWDESIISPIFNKKGRIINYLKIGADVTDRKKAEEALKIALEKATESDRLKTAFLLNVSHEIRTPMNGILGFANLLKESGLSIEARQNYLVVIEKSAHRMLNTINEIVDISLLEAGQVNVNISQVNVNSQLEEVYRFFIQEAEQKGIQLEWKERLPESHQVITTDEHKLHGILTNLLKNALKFTREGSIELGCRYTDSGSKPAVRFYVKDTGIGIPKKRQKAVFDRFVQADIEDKMAYQGLGLGLSIAKAYVEMLGGKIGVESEEGKGSLFYFTLPVKTEKPLRQEEREPAFSEPELLQNRKLKILVVEDDEASERLLSILVKSISKETLVAHTGQEALEISRRHPDIDIILMDIKLPDINGLEVTRKIRERNSTVLIIAQTAHAMLGDREKTLAAGCNDYISKPISKKSLLQLIAHLLNDKKP